MANTKKKFFLIDAMAMAFRNFHALGPNLKTTSGHPISAVFGSAQFMMKLIAEENPDYLALLCDHKDKTFRHELYPEYKAHRTEMPEELAAQLDLFFELFTSLGVKCLVMPKYEADDIIGSICEQYASEDVEIYIVSGDKDFAQCIKPGVNLYTPKKGGEVIVLDKSAVKEKYDVHPNQFIDYLALIGDASDNIPGVKGIGPKGASKLINDFGDLDGIFDNLDSVKNKNIRAKLEHGKEDAYLSRDLVTIKTDLELDESIDEFSIEPYQCLSNKGLVNFYQKLEFNRIEQMRKKCLDTLQKALSHSGANNSEEGSSPIPQQSESNRNVNYQIITTRESFLTFLKKWESAKAYAFDTETTGLDIMEDRPIGFSISFQSGEAFYVPLQENQLEGDFIPSEIIQAVKPILESGSAIKIAHNLKYDWHMLHQLGITVGAPIADTMIMAFIDNPIKGSFSLDKLSLEHLNIHKIPTTDLIGKKSTKTPQLSMLDVPLDKLGYYACEDADCTWQLYQYYDERLQKENLSKIGTDIEFPLLPVIANMEEAGVYIDKDHLQELSKKLEDHLSSLQKGLFEIAGEEFNLNSPKQLQTIIFEKLKIHEELKVRSIKKTKSGYSTDASVLDKLSDHPFAGDLLKYRMYSKLKNTYVDVLPQLVNKNTHKIHTTFSQTGAATGRLASLNPNLQNIPIRSEYGKQIRAAFVPSKKEHIIISADYSQVELRILAHIAEENHLIQAFADGVDIHRATASKMFGMAYDEVDADARSRAKSINFGIIYGMGPSRLARETKVKFTDAKQFIEKYFESYPKIKEYTEKALESAKKRGYAETIMGRRRPIPELESSNPGVVVNGQNIAINSPIQGSAADIIKLAMINIHQKMQEQSFEAAMLIQIHDELVFECHESTAESFQKMIRFEMENALKLKVPLKVDIGTGRSWLEAH